MTEDKTAQTLDLLQKAWTFFLIALYFIGFLTAYHFPGIGEDPVGREKILFDAQKVLFFGLMVAGFLVDAVRMRDDRQKAFIFLFLSLILGGLSEIISATQFKAVALLFVSI